MREVPKDVLKMASGLISPSGHGGQLCNGVAAWYSARVFDILFTLCFVLPEPGPAASQETKEEETGRCST